MRVFSQSNALMSNSVRVFSQCNESNALNQSSKKKKKLKVNLLKKIPN